MVKFMPGIRLRLFCCRLANFFLFLWHFDPMWMDAVAWHDSVLYQFYCSHLLCREIMTSKARNNYECRMPLFAMISPPQKSATVLQSFYRDFSQHWWWRACRCWQVFHTRCVSGCGASGGKAWVMCDQHTRIYSGTCHHSFTVFFGGNLSCIGQHSWHCNSYRTTCVHDIPCLWTTR